MGYFRYLYNNRLSRKETKHGFIKLWGKRFFNFPALVRLELNLMKVTKNGARIGHMSVISPHCEFNGSLKNLKIGNECSVGTAHLALHDRITIGNNCVINEGVRIFTASHDVNSLAWEQIPKPVTIGDYVWIASGAIILPGVSIGDNSVIGAGSVVSKDVGNNEVIAGNPARIIKHRKKIPFNYSPVRFLASFECWIGTKI